MQRDEEVDDVIAKLNPNAKRRDSTDSLNFRDSAFDPMSVKRGGGDLRRAKEYTGLIQPIAVDPMRELGKGLG